MPASQKIGLLKKAANTDIQLSQAWTVVKTTISSTNLNKTTTYKEYLRYLVSHSEKLEESSVDKSGCKANIADTHFMQLYLPEDSYYNEATNLVAYMGEQDVDMIHLMLQCNQALQEGKPRPRPRLQRGKNQASLSYR